MFSQNFSIISFVARELHLLKVEGLNFFIFFLKSSRNSPSFEA
jgi:hypothetical protein